MEKSTGRYIFNYVNPQSGSSNAQLLVSELGNIDSVTEATPQASSSGASPTPTPLAIPAGHNIAQGKNLLSTEQEAFLLPNTYEAKEKINLADLVINQGDKVTVVGDNIRVVGSDRKVTVKSLASLSPDDKKNFENIGSTQSPFSTYGMSELDKSLFVDAPNGATLPEGSDIAKILKTDKTGEALTKKFGEDGLKDYKATRDGNILSVIGPNGKETKYDINPDTGDIIGPVVEAKTTIAPQSKLFGVITTPRGFFISNLVDGVNWALAAGMGVQLIGRLVGLQETQVNSVSLAVSAGILAGKITNGIIQKTLASKGASGSLLTKAAPWGVGVAVALLVLQATYKQKQTREEKRIFECLPWEPQLGGDNCEKCNSDPFRPCSEYRCKSLGQACELLNPGSDKELCTWVSPKDVTSPTISPWKDVLRPIKEDLRYAQDAKRPPSRGVKILSGRGRDNCLKAFTPLQFGIQNNEPAQCKIDVLHTEKFDDMAYYMGETSLYLYNHTQSFTLPNAPSEENGSALQFPNEGEYAFYIRCRDANGNENVDEYTMKFCVDPTPDTTPPLIEGTSIPSGNYVQYNSENVPIDIYVNEPAECKWSRQSKAFEEMENAISCSSNPEDINSNLLYTCSAALTGIKNKEDNKFYFRCKDNPSLAEGERNVNVQSYEFLLRGSQPLDILKTEPNKTITGSTDTVAVQLAVETSNGAEEGKSICFFSPTTNSADYVQMFETKSYTHKQLLDLTSGTYTYNFKCVDAGGNIAQDSTTFTVLIDKQAPKVTRAYKEGALKIITNEEAQCVYSLSGCNYNFAEGISLLYSNPSIKTSHFAEWNSNNVYHIKCKDNYGNEPSPSQCAIVVSAIEITQPQEL